jgi:hypothetical protein
MENENVYQVSVGTPKGRDQYKNLGVHARIILK